MFYLVLLVLGQITYTVGEPSFATKAECEVVANQERDRITEMFARGIISRGPDGQNIKPADVAIECMLDTSGDHKT